MRQRRDTSWRVSRSRVVYRLWRGLNIRAQDKREKVGYRGSCTIHTAKGSKRRYVTGKTREEVRQKLVPIRPLCQYAAPVTVVSRVKGSACFESRAL